MALTDTKLSLKTSSGQMVIHYLQNVLGLHQVLLPIEVDPEQAKPKVIFLDENQRGTAEGAELLQKMIGAMKLPISETLYLESSVAHLAAHLEILEQASLIFSFSTPITDFLTSNFPRLKVLQTHSPQDMIKNAALKREAWEVLKQGMKILG